MIEDTPKVWSVDEGSSEIATQRYILELLQGGSPVQFNGTFKQEFSNSERRNADLQFSATYTFKDTSGDVPFGIKIGIRHDNVYIEDLVYSKEDGTFRNSENFVRLNNVTYEESAYNPNDPNDRRVNIRIVPKSTFSFSRI